MPVGGINIPGSIDRNMMFRWMWLGLGTGAVDRDRDGTGVWGLVWGIKKNLKPTEKKK